MQERGLADSGRANNDQQRLVMGTPEQVHRLLFPTEEQAVVLGVEGCHAWVRAGTGLLWWRGLIKQIPQPVEVGLPGIALDAVQCNLRLKVERQPTRLENHGYDRQAAPVLAHL